MSVPTMTRLTTAFSRTARNHAHAFSAYAIVYNFCRPHGALTKEQGRKTTPAMAVDLEERPWTMLEVVERTDADREVFV